MIELRLRADVGLVGFQSGDQVTFDPEDPGEFIRWRPASWPIEDAGRIREILREALAAGKMTVLTPNLTVDDALRMLGTTLRLVR